MKKLSGLTKFFVILAVIFGAATVFLLYANSKQAKNNTQVEINPDTMKLIQLEPPKDGDKIAIVDTTLGEFRFVLYPEQSPNGVKNFTELAEMGYYDGTYVFNSESGAYSAAGSKLKNGEMPEGYDVDRELVQRELHQDLWPFKGAINMGFRGEKLVAVLVMLGSATTGSCFVMVKNFGHKGTITAFAVMLTTICSAFTLTLWLFLLRSKGYI